MITTSFTSTGSTDRHHLVRRVSVGIYSRSHLFQNWSAICCDTRHCFLVMESVGEKTPGAATPATLDVPIIKWKGVSASSSSVSIET